MVSLPLLSLLILARLQNEESLVVVLIYSEQCHGSDCPCAMRILGTEASEQIDVPR